MSQIIMPRRRFLAGLVGLVAAPMVVKASSLMPVKLFDPTSPSDMVWSMIYRANFPAPGVDNWMTIAHRRDLRDLGEPYLSLVRLTSQTTRTEDDPWIGAKSALQRLIAAHD